MHRAHGRSHGARARDGSGGVPHQELDVVIASHGNYDRDAIEAASTAEAAYVALVASQKRAKALGVPKTVKCPAGLDIGAVTPEEIALSILAEIVSIRRGQDQHGRELQTADDWVAKDPICGMMVAVEGARHTSIRGDNTFYFCGASCKDAYELKHAD